MARLRMSCSRVTVIDAASRAWAWDWIPVTALDPGAEPHAVQPPASGDRLAREDGIEVQEVPRDQRDDRHRRGGAPRGPSIGRLRRTEQRAEHHRHRQAQKRYEG